MSDLAKLELYISEVVDEIERWIERVDEHPASLRYKPEDYLRLFKLRVWSVRYSVSIQECLDMIVPVLRAVIKSRKKSYGLGIAIKTLTSRGTERLLGEMLLERYPGNENVKNAREQERERQIEAESLEELDGLSVRGQMQSILEVGAEEYVRLYQKRILKYRGQMDVATIRHRQHRKAYRGNPWN